MKTYKEFFKEQENLEESSLSRLWQHNIDHDCGAITAFRLYEGCGICDDCETFCKDADRCKSEGKPKRVTRKENDKRNIEL